MKRIMTILLAAALLAACAGCNQIHDSTHTTLASGQETTEPFQTQAVILPELPIISVSLPIVEESSYASDDAMIFSHVYQNMSLILPEQEIADEIIVDFLNRIDHSADAQSIQAAAQKNYSTGNWVPYLCQIEFEPMRIDSGVLSLFGNYTTYNGTPHPETDALSVSYDLTTGKVIALNEIIAPQSVDALINAVVDALTEQAAQMNLFEDFRDTVTDRFRNGLSHEYNWYFTSDGLCFYFSPYDIAPYSSGVIVAQVSYAQLAGLMDDAYFPAERESIRATLTSQPFTQADTEDISGFSEVVIDKDGEKTILRTDACVYDVRIQLGSWSEDGSTYIPERCIYAAYALSADNAIVVHHGSTDTFPTIRVSYEARGETQYRFLPGNGNVPNQ